MIKIAHITTIDMSLRYLLLNQLRSIQQAGYEVVAISSPGSDVPSIEAAGVRHIPVPMTRNLTPLADLLSLFRLYRIMRRERFDVVHAHNPKPGLLGQLAARIAGVPIVVNTLHGFYFHDHMRPTWRRFYITMEKIAARCSDIIFSQNKDDIQTAIKEGICSPEKIKHLGNGIDVRRFDRTRLDAHLLAQKRRELGLPPIRPVVGFVGRLVTEKGILELLQAARIVVQRIPEVRFLIIGRIDREKPDALTPEVARDYGVADICVFTGMRQDMPELYALMDVFVLPSHREGFPRSPMEASAMGVPCVVTDIRGCRETVDHNLNGLLVPLGDVQALAGAVIEILTDRETARRMGEEGRRMALERFDERRVFEKVKAEYARLLQAKGLTLSEPKIEVKEALLMNKKRPDFGALIISLDFEIHWGVRGKRPADESYRQNLLGVRRAIPQMLDLFEEFGIVATWATVGFLFAASRQELESFYPSVRPEYDNPILSPYQEPVGEGEEDDPLHFAPSLIEAISKRPHQEIGTHTFSHYYCLERGQTRSAFRADLQSAVAIARKYGFQLRSIVFPRNQFNPDYAGLLVEAGIVCYRDNEKGWMHRASVTLEQKPYVRGARLLDHYLSLTGLNLICWDDILEENGLCNVASSRFLRPYSPRLRHLDALRLGRIAKGIQAAAISKQLFHLRWHPHNFGSYVDENIAFLRKILKTFARFRESHGMRSLTMADVAEIVKGRA